MPDQKQKKGSGFVFNENEKFNDVTGVGGAKRRSTPLTLIEFFGAKKIIYFKELRTQTLEIIEFFGSKQ